MKIMAIVDRHRLPLSITTHAANHHDHGRSSRAQAPLKMWIKRVWTWCLVLNKQRRFHISLLKSVMLESAKALIRRVLPQPVYLGGRTVWQVTQRMRDWISGALIWSRFALTSGVPKILILLSDSPGDNLLCTAVLRELRKRNQGRLGMISKFPELFRSGGNDAMCIVKPQRDKYNLFAKIWGRDFRHVHYIMAGDEYGIFHRTGI